MYIFKRSVWRREAPPLQLLCFYLRTFDIKSGAFIASKVLLPPQISIPATYTVTPRNIPPFPLSLSHYQYTFQLVPALPEEKLHKTVVKSKGSCSRA